MSTFEPAISPAARWTGRVLSGLIILFLLFDGAIKLIPIQPVTDAMTQLGFSSVDAQARTLGVLTLVCTIFYAVPSTSLLGAILLTGYLGGAIATHLRADSPLLTHLLFGFYLGLAVWGGLWLRDPALRALLPFRGLRTT